MGDMSGQSWTAVCHIGPATFCAHLSDTLLIDGLLCNLLLLSFDGANAMAEGSDTDDDASSHSADEGTCNHRIESNSVGAHRAQSPTDDQGSSAHVRFPPIEAILESEAGHKYPVTKEIEGELSPISCIL